MTPAMRPNWRSSGAATEVAMVSGLAPGSAADTWMVGKSTCGSDATGSSRKPSTPASGEADGEQRRRDGPRDERRGDVHDGDASGCGASGGCVGGAADARARRSKAR